MSLEQKPLQIPRFPTNIRPHLLSEGDEGTRRDAQDNGEGQAQAMVLARKNRRRLPTAENGDLAGTAGWETVSTQFHRGEGRAVESEEAGEREKRSAVP